MIDLYICPCGRIFSALLKIKRVQFVCLRRGTRHQVIKYHWVVFDTRAVFEKKEKENSLKFEQEKREDVQAQNNIYVKRKKVVQFDWLVHIRTAVRESLRGEKKHAAGLGYSRKLLKNISRVSFVVIVYIRLHVTLKWVLKKKINKKHLNVV